MARRVPTFISRSGSQSAYFRLGEWLARRVPTFISRSGSQSAYFCLAEWLAECLLLSHRVPGPTFVSQSAYFCLAEWLAECLLLSWNAYLLQITNLSNNSDPVLQPWWSINEDSIDDNGFTGYKVEGKSRFPLQ